MSNKNIERMLIVDGRRRREAVSTKSEGVNSKKAAVSTKSEGVNSKRAVVSTSDERVNSKRAAVLTRGEGVPVNRAAVLTYGEGVNSRKALVSTNCERINSRKASVSTKSEGGRLYNITDPEMQRLTNILTNIILQSYGKIDKFNILLRTIDVPNKEEFKEYMTKILTYQLTTKPFTYKISAQLILIFYKLISKHLTLTEIIKSAEGSHNFVLIFKLSDRTIKVYRIFKEILTKPYDPCKMESKIKILLETQRYNNGCVINYEFEYPFKNSKLPYPLYTVQEYMEPYIPAKHEGLKDCIKLYFKSKFIDHFYMFDDFKQDNVMYNPRTKKIQITDPEFKCLTIGFEAPIFMNKPLINYIKKTLNVDMNSNTWHHPNLVKSILVTKENQIILINSYLFGIVMITLYFMLIREAALKKKTLNYNFKPTNLDCFDHVGYGEVINYNILRDMINTLFTKEELVSNYINKAVNKTKVVKLLDTIDLNKLLKKYSI